MEVAAITQRTNPVLPTIIPATDGGEVAVLRRARERLLWPIVKGAIPELVDYALPGWGGGERFAVLAVGKTYPRQARKVASAVWGLAALEFTKFVVVVDEHIDVHDAQSVLAAIGANVHPGRDVFFHEGPGHAFDHASPTPRLGHHLGIDATRKLPGEHDRPWPTELAPSREIVELVTRRWREYGIRMTNVE
jgi:4-hydroxy-3-polyprenylbenzoate decarboxylase